MVSSSPLLMATLRQQGEYVVLVDEMLLLQANVLLTFDCNARCRPGKTTGLQLDMQEWEAKLKVGYTPYRNRRTERA